MEKLFKCKYTGKIFNNELDCIESEYINGEEAKQFTELVYKFIDLIENKHNIKIDRETLNIYDKLENYYDDRMIHWRHLGFKFIINGTKKEYYRTSDSVGDGRWEWYINTLEEMVKDFEKEFIVPNQRMFEGIIRYEYNDNDRYCNTINWFIGDKSIDTLFGIFEGKKVIIKIIE
jgi:hypothetical protein